MTTPDPDAVDQAVGRYAREAGLVTAEQLAAALQARRRGGGAGVSLADALLQLGHITPAQRAMIEAKAQGKAEPLRQLLHYKLSKKLGEGGMGAVYLAMDTRAIKMVALKVLPREYGANVEYVRRFRREAAAAARLQHPNIVRAFDQGEDAGLHFYTMEYCEGVPLDRHLVVEKKLAVPHAIAILLDVARGLGYAHDHGVIHRDVKPGNIFLVKDGPAKILDLGLSKILDGPQTTFQTASGAVMGTPHYISPEQADGGKPVDGRTDIYSLGATLYHMLSGDTPFPGSTALEIMYKHVHEQIPDPRDGRDDVPDGLVQILRRMMAKDTADRYPSCAEIITDLEEVRDGRPPKSRVMEAARTTIAPLRKASTAPRKPATVRRQASLLRRRPGSPLPWVLGAAGLLAVVLLASGAGRRKAEPLVPVLKPPAVAREQPAPPKPPVVEAPAATPKPVVPVPLPPDPPPKPVPPRVLELLSLVAVAGDAQTGSWRRSGGALVSDETADALVKLPYYPPGEYDFIVEFSRTDGKCATLQLLVWNGRPFAWTLNAGREMGAGFALVAGKEVGENPTSRPAFRVSPGVRHVSEIRVRRDSVTALVDGVEVSRWTPSLGGLSPHAALTLADPAALGVGSCGTVTTFYRIAVAEVGGPGRLLRPLPRPYDPARGKEIAALPPARQVEAVMGDLRERNPGFDGRHEAEIKDGRVVGLSFSSVGVHDIAPLAALPALSKLRCEGVWDDVRKRLLWGGIEKLEALRGLPLTQLDLARNPVEDLSPLRGMPLVNMGIATTRVADLGPLGTLPLRVLDMGDIPARDLGPLRGLRLTYLAAWKTAVEDLTPLAAAPLEGLNLSGSRVRDVGPLRGKPLTYLDLEECPVSDLSPLRGLPVGQLIGPFDPVRDAALLGSMKSLRTVNGVPVAEFLKRKAVPAAPWRPLFDGKSLDFLTLGGEGSWVVARGAIEKKAGMKGAAQTVEAFGDAEIRFRFEAVDVGYLSLRVRQGPEGASGVEFDRNTLKAMGPGPHELVFRCRGDRVEPAINGKPAALTERSQVLRGNLQVASVDGVFRLLSIDVREAR